VIDMAVMYSPGATALTLKAITQNIFNVTNPPYSAPADGSNDASAGINTAIVDAAAAAVVSGGNSIVLCPPGKYRLDKTIFIQSNVTLWAYGAYFYFHIGTSGNQSALLANYVVGGAATPTGYNGESHIRVLGGTWDGQGNLQAFTQEHDVIEFGHCTDIVVKDVRVLNVVSAHAIEFNSTDGGSAINCRCEGFIDASVGSIRQYSEAIQIDVAAYGSISQGAYDGTPSTNILIDGCISQPSQAYLDAVRSGIPIGDKRLDGIPGPFGKLVGSHTTTNVFSTHTNGGPYSNIRVVNCTSVGSLDIGIRAFAWQNSVIENNAIYNAGLSTLGGSGSGISVERGHSSFNDPNNPVYTATNVSFGMVVANNVISSLSQFDQTHSCSNGIEIIGEIVDDEDVLVETCVVGGNSIDLPSADGIYVDYGHRCVITGNIVEGSASTAFHLLNSPFCDMEYNHAYAPAKNFGFFIDDGSDYCAARFNTVTKPSSDGAIAVGPVARASIDSNVVNLDGSAITLPGVSIDTGATNSIVVNNALDGTPIVGSPTHGPPDNY
jgi:putative cofactor-binding repeat protein